MKAGSLTLIVLAVAAVTTLAQGTSTPVPDPLWPKFVERLVDPVTWFTGFLLIVSIFQWRAMLRQSKHMEDGLAETRASIDEATRSAKAMERIAEAMTENVVILKDAMATNKEIAAVNAKNLALNSTVILSLEDLAQSHRELYDRTTELLIHYRLRNSSNIPVEVRQIICKSGLRDDVEYRAGWSKQPVGEIFPPGAVHGFVHTVPLYETESELLDEYAEGRLVVSLRLLVFATNPLGEKRVQIFGRRLICSPKGALAAFVFNPPGNSAGQQNDADHTTSEPSEDADVKGD